ncbi:hypothetical protein BSKO_11097 [Bryopsis sp. KO-2023]|nr:hypothetical protein BSKO_11097 [Bryopsis sp. KO-2023]
MAEMKSHRYLPSFNGDPYARKVDEPLSKTATAENGGVLTVPTIFDIKENDHQCPLVQEVFQSFVNPPPTAETITCELYQPDGTKRTRRLSERMRKLPSEILYDARGLELFERITELEDEYYLTRCEREILRTQMPDIAKYVTDGASIVELGCGSLSKTATFLKHVREAGRRDVRFFALDIEKSFLEASLKDLMEDEQKQDVPAENRIEYAGIYGSYTDALSSFLKDIIGQKVLLWLGSSIGNFSRADSNALVGRFQKELMKEGDVFFIGMDKRKDPATVARAYNDAGGVTSEFGLNGLDHLCRMMGNSDMDRMSFDYFAGYNDVEGRHEAYYRSNVAQTVSVPRSTGGFEKVDLEKDELIRYEFSVKYSMEEIQELASSTGLVLERTWTDAQDMYNFCMFRKPFSNGPQ